MASKASKPKLIERTAYMKKLHGNISRDIALLKKEHERLEKKEKFLRSEALLHQAELELTESRESRSIFSFKNKLMLRNDQIETLQKHLECIRKVSGVNIIHVAQETETVEEPDEADIDLTILRKPQSTKRKGVIEEEEEAEAKGLVKTVNIEGMVTHLKFKIECSANFMKEKRNGNMVKIHNMDINPLPSLVQVMHNAFKPLPPSYMSRFFSNLHYLQMLEEERDDTGVSLEESIPDLIVSSESEPWIFKLHPRKDQLISLLWTFAFDENHLRIQNKISINCDEEVVAYYSQNKDIFPYLSSRKILRTADDVTNFFESF